MAHIYHQLLLLRLENYTLLTALAGINQSKFYGASEGAILDRFSNAVAVETSWDRGTPLLSAPQTGNKRHAVRKRACGRLTDHFLEAD
jgi:hypothetical protein